MNKFKKPVKPAMASSFWLNDENKEEVFDIFFIMNQNLAKIATKISKTQIDLSNILKMNKEILTLTK